MVNAFGHCFVHHENIVWLVVSTPLKSISQLGWLFPMYGKKHVPNHQPVLFYTIKNCCGFQNSQTNILLWPKPGHRKHAQASDIALIMGDIADTSPGNQSCRLQRIADFSRLKKLLLWTLILVNSIPLPLCYISIFVVYKSVFVIGRWIKTLLLWVFEPTTSKNTSHHAQPHQM